MSWTRTATVSGTQMESLCSTPFPLPTGAVPKRWNTGGRHGRSYATPSLLKRGLTFVSTTEAMSVRAWSFFPTVHEGATVRAMEKKGIRTEKGEFNRWIKATNAVIRDIKKKIALLFDWIAEAKAELAKPQAPDLVSLLNAYYTQRRAGAYSQKGKVSNLKEMNETFNYLRANGIYSLEDLESRVSEHSAATESLKKTLDEADRTNESN